MPDFGERLRHEILNPGDMLTADNASALKRIPIGPLGQVWTVLANGQPGWAPAGGGAVSNNYASVHMSAGQTIPNDNASYDIKFDTVDFDPAGMFVPNLGSPGAGQFRVAATDLYLVDVQVGWNNTTAGDILFCELYTNPGPIVASDVRSQIGVPLAAPTFYPIQQNRIVKQLLLTAGTAVGIQARAGLPPNNNPKDISASVDQTFWQIARRG